MTSFWANATSVASNNPGWVTPASGYLAIAPGALQPDVFRTWPRADQLAYLNQWGGTAKTVDIGPANNRVNISLAPPTILIKLGDADGEAVEIRDTGRRATAAEFATIPSALEPNVFLAWRREDQIAYVTANSDTTIGGGVPPLYVALQSDVAFDGGVIQYTSGDFEPIPYKYLDGSSTGTPSAIVAASAEALFPTLDGDEHTLPIEDRPDEFYTTPAELDTDAKKMAFLGSFAKWHSAFQLEYIKNNGTNGVLDIQVGTPETRLTAVVSLSDPTKHYILQALDKQAFAKMSYADQVQLTGVDGFADLATRVGLSTASATVVGDVTSTTNPPAAVTAETAVDRLIDYIEDHTAATPARKILERADEGSGWSPPATGNSSVYWQYQGDNKWHLYHQPSAPPTMNDTDKGYFIQQLEILKDQLDTMGVVSAQDISKKISELKERFDRACAFYEVTPPQRIQVWMGNPGDWAVFYADVISIGGDLSSIQKGYQVFIAQEKRIAELAQARMDLVRDNGALFGKNLDVPYLVYKFQSLYNLSLEAQVVMETEEVNQQNDLLKTYARMQDIINRTLSAFAKSDEDGKFILNKSVDDLATSRNAFTLEELYAISMFEDVVGAGQGHPLEKLRNIKRPTGEIFGQNNGSENTAYDLARQTHPQWSTFGTRLSETVTLINQNSQIKMNDINTMDKQRNRHFELANNALSKMAEMVQSIARAA